MNEGISRAAFAACGRGGRLRLPPAELCSAKRRPRRLRRGLPRPQAALEAGERSLSAAGKSGAFACG